MTGSLAKLVAGQPLQGKRIMVTRPAHQADELCGYIQRAGGEAYRFPALVIKDTPHVEQAKAALATLDNIDMLIFVSPNAVEYGFRYLVKIPASVQTATIGAGSARALTSKLGQSPDIVPETVYNSEALLTHARMQQVTGKRILILRGNGGRNKLAETLRERGARVSYVEVYQRSLPEADQAQLARDWQQQTMDAIVVTSGEALKNLPQLAGEHLQTRLHATQLVVVNTRLQNLARQSGFTGTITVAEQASDVAILAALIKSLS